MRKRWKERGSSNTTDHLLCRRFSLATLFRSNPHEKKDNEYKEQQHFEAAANNNNKTK